MSPPSVPDGCPVGGPPHCSSLGDIYSCQKWRGYHSVYKVDAVFLVGHPATCVCFRDVLNH